MSDYRDQLGQPDTAEDDILAQCTTGTPVIGIAVIDDVEHYAVTMAENPKRVIAITGVVGKGDDAESIANTERIRRTWHADANLRIAQATCAELRTAHATATAERDEAQRLIDALVRKESGSGVPCWYCGAEWEDRTMTHRDGCEWHAAMIYRWNQKQAAGEFVR